MTKNEITKLAEQYLETTIAIYGFSKYQYTSPFIVVEDSPYDDADDSSKPMNVRLDEHNPIHSLRARKILGLDVLKDLKFNANEKRWEDGVIYDPKSGRHWSSVVYFNNNGLLEVKGYWKFEFLCKTITFKKVN